MKIRPARPNRPLRPGNIHRPVRDSSSKNPRVGVGDDGPGPLPTTEEQPARQPQEGPSSLAPSATPSSAAGPCRWMGPQPGPPTSSTPARPGRQARRRPRRLGRTGSVLALTQFGGQKVARLSGAEQPELVCSSCGPDVE
jgi:hypothetical protein